MTSKMETHYDGVDKANFGIGHDTEGFFIDGEIATNAHIYHSNQLYFCERCQKNYRIEDLVEP